MIFCACSAREEEQWKAQLLDSSTKEGRRHMEDSLGMPPLYAVMNLDMKPFGQVYRYGDKTDHALSIQRAATLPRSTSYQVIIKNTNATKDQQNRNVSPLDSVSRSQSLMASNRVSILAPKRTERARMEHQLAGVWTRELLPYPGMGGQRGENMIRNSASSMLRRLRGTSLSSTVSRLSTSVSSLADSRSEHLQDYGSLNNDDLPKERPKLHGSKSLDVGLCTRDQTVGASRIKQAVKRSHSTAAARLHRSRRTVENIPAVDARGPKTYHHHSENGSDETVRTKRTAATGFFTGFSAEGIRGWFNSAH